MLMIASDMWSRHKPESVFYSLKDDGKCCIYDFFRVVSVSFYETFNKNNFRVLSWIRSAKTVTSFMATEWSFSSRARSVLQSPGLWTDELHMSRGQEEEEVFGLFEWHLVEWTLKACVFTISALATVQLSSFCISSWLTAAQSQEPNQTCGSGPVFLLMLTETDLLHPTAHWMPQISS